MIEAGADFPAGAQQGSASAGLPVPRGLIGPRAGAVFLGAAVAQHYGNPLAEQKMLMAGHALVDLSDRAVVSITGPDRLSWLDSLTSQSLTGLQPGESVETLLLDPAGRIEHAIRVFDDGDTSWLLLDGEQGEPLAAWLDRMRFTLRVEVARVERYATLGVFERPEQLSAPGASVLEPSIFERLSDLAVVAHGVPLIWRDPWVAVVAGGYQYAAVAAHPASEWRYREVLVPREADLSDFAAAGTLALDALRIAAWRPSLANEVDSRSIPHELDWLRSAVHLSKGCYRGQETVAKVHNLGHPPRRLVMLHLDGSQGDLPRVGAAVEHNGTELGTITSVAVHYDLGPIALALIKRSTDPAATLTVRGDTAVSAAQELIVPTDAGAVASVPRLPRLGSVTRPLI